jgi:hypothetical protein
MIAFTRLTTIDMFGCIGGSLGAATGVILLALALNIFLLATFPFTLDDGMPDANTISKSSATYWNYLIPLTVIFVTFPQAVTRSAGLSNEKSPTEAMGAYWGLFHIFQGTMAFTTSPNAPNCSSCPSR